MHCGYSLKCEYYLGTHQYMRTLDCNIVRKDARALMWSVAFHGRRSVLSDQARILFPVSDSYEPTRRSLAIALQSGLCMGVFIGQSDESRLLNGVHKAVQNALQKNTLLTHSQITYVATTGDQWAAGELMAHAQSVVLHLQAPKLDLLLLSANTLRTCLPSGNIYDTKRAVLSYWEQMMQLQDCGIVSAIGVSDFSVAEIEFIIAAHPDRPPSVLVMAVATALPSSDDGKLGHQSDLAERGFLSMLSFAHERSIDVMVHLPFRMLDALTPEIHESWSRAVHSIAQRQRELVFDVPTMHESDSAPPFKTTKHSMHDTQALQTPLQTLMRYMLQKGVVVVPILAESDENQQLEETECQELFESLLHPFTSLGPMHSPNRLYSSLLSSHDLAVIEHALPLQVTSIATTPI